MPEKTYRPKSGNDGLQVEAAIERSVVGYKDADGKSVTLDQAADPKIGDRGLEPVYNRAEGETFSVDSWPYTTSDPAEQAYLDTLDALTDQAAPAPKKTSGNGGGS